MEAWDSPQFKAITNQADLVTPDGMPLVWGLKLPGVSQEATPRVYRPGSAADKFFRRRWRSRHTRSGFYGGSSPAGFSNRLQHRGHFSSAIPALQIRIAHAFSPPFRPLDEREEDEEVVSAINRSGASILFIGLNTPKQDYWMAAHRGKVQSVMLSGVGAGASISSLGNKMPLAPRWMKCVAASRMGVSLRHRTAASVEALPEAQPPLRCVVRPAVNGLEANRKRRDQQTIVLQRCPLLFCNHNSYAPKFR